MPHFEFTQAVLVQCNIVNNDYEQDSRALYKFVANKPFDSLLKCLQKIISFLKHLIQHLELLKYGL